MSFNHYSKKNLIFLIFITLLSSQTFCMDWLLGCCRRKKTEQQESKIVTTASVSEFKETYDIMYDTIESLPPEMLALILSYHKKECISSEYKLNGDIIKLYNDGTKTKERDPKWTRECISAEHDTKKYRIIKHFNDGTTEVELDEAAREAKSNAEQEMAAAYTMLNEMYGDPMLYSWNSPMAIQYRKMLEAIQRELKEKYSKYGIFEEESFCCIS